MKRPKYQIIEIAELEKAIKDICKNHEDIQLVYLYGSYVKNYQTEFSDIDIGVFLDRKFEGRPLYFAQLNSEINQKFNYKINTDIRILNNATPRFLFQVINRGKILYYKDKNFKDEFEIKIITEYLDIKPLLNHFDNQYLMEVLKDDY